MVSHFKLFIIGLSALALASCAVTASRARLGPDIFQVGEIEVRLYQNRNDLVNDLPASVSWLEGVRMGSVKVKVCGYFDQEKNRIYAIDDARILLHELRHYFEPEWKHDGQMPLCDPARNNR